MLTLQNIKRCGRCNVILTEDEMNNQRYDDRTRCGGCESLGSGSIHDFRTFAGVRTPEHDGQSEWLRRVHVAEFDKHFY